MLRDQLIAEINSAQDADELALWAHRRFATKNTLRAEDAKAVELAYLASLKASSRDDLHQMFGPGRESSEIDSRSIQRSRQFLPLRVA